MDKPKKKKKLVVKKKGIKGGIANKIAREQKEQELRKTQEIARQKAALGAKQEQRSADPKAQQKTKVVFDNSQKRRLNQNTQQQQPQHHSKGKKSKGKSNLREDILKQEEHKKFFLKQQNQEKGRRGSDSLSTSSIPKSIKITEFIQVGELARKLNVKTSDIIGKLMAMGEFATITQSIDADTATLLAGEYGCKIDVVSLYDETVIAEEEDKEEDLIPRPPVVTVMGHVDHGKTKLLDALREADVVSGEAGGITQHIGAYQVSTPRGKITFLDTPGHEAFTSMRARGANLTDIVILVVAADDGVMPQTIEAIKHAKDAGVPIIVAINKIDLETANVEKIKQEISQHDVVPEEWGGSSPFIEVSALKKLNLDKLVNQVVANAEMLELRANPNRKAVGIVVEAKLDQGRGSVATVLVSNGTLEVQDPFVVGTEGGRIRAMMDDHGNRVKTAAPGTPVEILGLTGVPNAGDPFHIMGSEKEAKAIIEKRQELSRQQQAQKIKKVKLENLNEIIQDGQVQELKVIIKADVQGSVEAIAQSLEKLANQEIRVNVILGSTGEIAESDVMLASAGNAIIIGFNTRANAKVREMAEREGVEIKYFSIIYKMVEEITDALSGMLSPDVTEEILGEAEVRQLFKISALGTVAGSMVKNGIIQRNKPIRVIRDGTVIYTGNIKALKRFQDDANEVKEGFECGILIDGYNDLKTSDIVECFTEKEVTRSLSDVKTLEKQDEPDSP